MRLNELITRYFTGIEVIEVIFVDRISGDELYSMVAPCKAFLERSDRNTLCAPVVSLHAMNRPTGCGKGGATIAVTVFSDGD